MNFARAQMKLRKVAAGKYYSIGFEVTEYCDGVLKADCRLYIDGYGRSFNGASWEEAFKELTYYLNPPVTTQADIDAMAPEQEPPGTYPELKEEILS